MSHEPSVMHSRMKTPSILTYECGIQMHAGVTAV